MTSDFYITQILPFAPIIIKICRAYTNNKTDFEDYYQEVCLQIWRSKDSFREQSQWSTWIYRLSLNVCMTYLKKTKNSPQQFASDSLPDEVVDDAYRADGSQKEDGTGDYEEDSINRLYDAIRHLSEIDRAVILLYLEEKSYQEIADITGTNANNVGVRIKRIKQRLNKLLNIKEA
ncbi:MAG: sigma-70 family RNA polymerase sigma factor [Psychrosphaera sp.]|nr:sigma-70 family RNA polymerase sigma factor [Psychrosphaera sp.]